MIERYSRELSEEWCRERYEWVMYESSEEWYRKRYEREMTIVKYDAELSGTPCHMTVKCRGGPKDTTHKSNTYRMVLYIPWMYVIWWEVESKSSESRRRSLNALLDNERRLLETCVKSDSESYRVKVRVMSVIFSWIEWRVVWREIRKLMFSY